MVRAATQWGALYALETFFQLVLVEPWEQCPSCDAYKLREDVPFVIRDAPLVPWRGLMVDTGRHFLPVALLKRTIDAMAARRIHVKYNSVARIMPFSASNA